MRNTKQPRLYQALTEKLTRRIAAGEFAVGERLPAERELAALFEVSRPTIREAIIALEIEGLVEVRVGSGVYVVSKLATRHGVVRDVGAFELTEARILVEGEVAALAAANITGEEIAELDRLLGEMERANVKSAGAGEAIDKRFHEVLAGASRNGAMQAIVEHLWMIRDRSPQCVLTFEKTRAKGHKPVVDEHRRIVEGVASRDPDQARNAMRSHLSRVLDYLLSSTEIDAIEEVRARAGAQRDRYSSIVRS